jgi:N-acetylmuramoyl-L-alanine amidase
MKRFSGFLTIQIIVLPLLLAMPAHQTASAQVTGLEGWNIFVDPGHSRTENMGLYNYSEAQKVLRVALNLREMLLEWTDIDTVYLSRTNDTQLVGLTERIQRANSLGADFYYSIHSDAGPPNVNSTLMLHGGWREGGMTVEKTPAGGKLFGDIMDTILTESMRIGRRGNYADRTFYQGFPFEHTNKFPYLAVNRISTMASLLSEAGFHTNPTQQQRNMNAEWKRLEAYAAFWTILEYHDLDRPDVGIATGYITNLETGVPVNGATVTIGGKTYTTDSFESLFRFYSSDPDQLANGFYFIEDLTPGVTYTVDVVAENFYPGEAEITITPSFFTFSDVKLVSSQPPFVVTTFPEPGSANLLPGRQSGSLMFSRPMDRESVEEAFSIEEVDQSGRVGAASGGGINDGTGPYGTLSGSSPTSGSGIDVAFNWASDTELHFTTANLDFEKSYRIRLADTARDQYGHTLDGDGDGQEGGEFGIEFTTADRDVTPPQLLAVSPADDDGGVMRRPIIRLQYDEPVVETRGFRSLFRLTKAGGEEIPGVVRTYTDGRVGEINFFPDEVLQPLTSYTFTLDAGVEDDFGNATTEPVSVGFTTGNLDMTTSLIDNFAGLSARWWVPQQSGSTTGIITELTSREESNTVLNPMSTSGSTLQLNYGWDLSSPPHLIRLYTGFGTNMAKQFLNTRHLQTFVKGDGSGNRFRFVVRDGSGGLEASPWYTITWTGWKLVSWDMLNDPVVPWVNADGVLTNPLYLDSFQMTYTPGSPNQGTVYFDNLRTASYTQVVSIEGPLADVPDTYKLDQNYPNPFNPATNIRFGVPEDANVRLEVFDLLGRRVAELHNGPMRAGYHTLNFDASRLASGVYIYTLRTDQTAISRKMLLVK